MRQNREVPGINAEAIFKKGEKKIRKFFEEENRRDDALAPVQEQDQFQKKD